MEYIVYGKFRPCLLNVKHLSELRSAEALEIWLSECNKKRSLDFEIKGKVYGIIKGNKGFRPISYVNLKVENKELFSLIELKCNSYILNITLAYNLLSKLIIISIL